MLSRRIIFLALCFVVLFNLNAAPRRAAYEHFTNTGCSPCAYWEPFLEEALEAFEDDEVVQIDFHVSWPGVDPFYLLNSDPVDAHVSDYGVTGVPAIFINGSTEIDLGDDLVDDMEAAIGDAVSSESPVDIDIEIDDSNIYVDVDVEEVTTGSFKLVVVVNENDIYFEAANGLTDFNHVFREAYPSMSGTVVDLSEIGLLEHEFSYTIDSEWDPINLEVVAYVKNTTTGEIIQANEANFPPPAYYYVLDAEETNYSGMIDDLEIVLYGELENLGENPDDFVVSLETDCPDDWLVSWCFGSHCMTPAFVCTSGVDPDMSEEISIHIGPAGVAGEGTFIIHAVSSRGREAKELEFSLIVRDPAALAPILIVDDAIASDGSDVDHMDYYTNAIDACETEYRYDTYDRDDGALSSEVLDLYDVVIWYCGSSWENTLEENDMIALAEFIDHGGNLLFSSAEAGWTIGGTDFYTDYLHNEFTADDDEASSTLLHGEAAPYDAFSGQLEGLTPADISRYNDIMHPISPATPILYYDASGTEEIAGLIYTEEDHKLIYLAFGFEYINNVDDRNQLMEIMLSWIAPADGVSEYKSTPDRVSLIESYPNPFNTSTNIEYTVSDNANTTVEIVDIMGNYITTLVDDYKTAGNYTAKWNGTDFYGNTVPTGMYMVKMNSGNQNSQKTLILSK